MWSVKHAETPKAKLGLWKQQTRLSIQQSLSSDAQIVEPQEEKQDNPRDKSCLNLSNKVFVGGELKIYFRPPQLVIEQNYNPKCLRVKVLACQNEPR